MFKVGLVVVGIAVVAGGVFMYARMDDEIRQRVQRLLAEQYPELSVSVGGARLVEGRGIAVYDLQLVDPSAPPGSDSLLSIDELMLACDAQLVKLMQGPPDVTRVEVKRPRLAVRRDRAGRWNVASLLPKKSLGTRPPQVIIHNGALSIRDELNREAPAISLAELHLTVTPTASQGNAAIGLKIDGALGGAIARRIDVQATVAGPNWQGAGTIDIEQLQLDEQLMAWARPMLPPWLQTVRASATLDGKVGASWSDLRTPPNLQATLAVTGGRVEDPRLPAPITELAGRLRVDGELQEIKDLHGRCGPAAVAISLNRTGWNLRAPLALAARADNVPLDGPLHGPIYHTLITAESEGLEIAGLLREQWDKYQPEGVVDATIQGTFDGATWTPTATLAGRGLSFESEKFPYRLEHGSGTIRCSPATADQPKLVDIDITAYSRETPLHIVGQVIDPQPGAAGWVQITGENLEVDQGMLAAIPNATSKKVIGELRPAGRFNISWRLDRPTPNAEPRTQLKLELTDMRINYEQFPYPLRVVRGVIAAQDNSWTFTDLVSAGRRPVKGHGWLRPTADGAHELALQFTAEQAPLDDALFNALKPNVQQAWMQLKPWGYVDLEINVGYRTGKPQPSIGVIIRPQESMSLRPDFFKYLMEKVSGTINYHDGRIDLSQLRAVNDNTVIRTNGAGQVWPDGRWEVQLSGLTVDHLAPGLELVSALPPKLRGLIERLKPTGHFTLHNGVLTFRQNASQISPLEVDWDVQLDCHQTNLQCGIDLKYIDGTVRLQGRSDAAGSHSAGELELESVTFQDVQFTNVRGPLWVNESKCLLGKSATDQRQLPTRRLTGNVYDGTLAADAWATFDNLPLYRADVQINGADLRRVVVERFHNQANYDGKIDANLTIGGRGSYLESLVGEGDVHIRDANLYELSLLASMVKMLRTGAADNTMFTQSDVAFRLQGKHITLDKIDFLGDVINLYGQGTTDFDQNLELAFSAVLGRHDYNLPLVKSFLRQASDNTVRLYVNGKLSDPQVTTEAFPGISQMFQQLGADLKNPFEAAERRAEERRRLAAQLPQGAVQ